MVPLKSHFLVVLARWLYCHGAQCALYQDEKPWCPCPSGLLNNYKKLIIDWFVMGLLMFNLRFFYRSFYIKINNIEFVYVWFKVITECCSIYIFFADCRAGLIIYKPFPANIELKFFYFFLTDVALMNEIYFFVIPQFIIDA